MRKTKVMEAVKELPEEFEMEVLIDKLSFVEKVEKGLHQLEEGKTISHDQVKEMVKQWS